MITGLNNPGTAQFIQESFEKRGYLVVTTTHDGPIEQKDSYDLVVGHSAGAYRAIKEFGTDKPGAVQVVALNSPHYLPFDNMHYVNSISDPVTLLQFINPLRVLGFVSDDKTTWIKGEKGRNPRNWLSDVHDKNDTFTKWMEENYDEETDSWSFE